MPAKAKAPALERPAEQQLPADAGHTGRIRPIAPRFIVLHATAGSDSRAWLTRTSPPHNPVSIHVLIDKAGTVYRSIPENREAWHAGFGLVGSYRREGKYNVNSASLGIELENLNNGHDPYTPEQINAAGYVIADYWHRYGHLPILDHGLIDARKTDPIGLDWPALMRSIAAWYLELTDAAAA